MEKAGKQKRKRSSRKLKGEWPDKKIWELISCVKLRPELWYVGSTNSGIPKPQIWQEVAAQLGNAFEWHDCRIKWQNLRVTYKCCLVKIEKMKSGQGTDETAKVRWRFFEAMRFISRSDGHHSTDSSSNFYVRDCSESLDMDSTDASCSTPTLQQSKRRQRSNRIGTPTPPPSVASSSIKDIAGHVLQIMHKSDEHASFGDYIAAELRSLPTQHAFALKRRLNRTLLDYWDEMELQTQTACVERFAPENKIFVKEEIE